MPPLSNTQTRPPKVLLYGKPGTGKTPFVTSYGRGMQFIDCDDGLDSSRRKLDGTFPFKDAFNIARQDVDVIQILEDDPSKANAFKRLKEVVMDIVSKCNRKEYPFEILALDSFTTIADHALRYVMFNSGKLVVDAKAFVPPTQQMWGLAINEVDNLFTWLKALPIPVVVIFHDRETEEGEKTIREIAIYGKNLPAKIISYFGEVIRQEAKMIGGKLEPYIRTESDAFITARSRQGVPNNTPTSIGFRKLLEMMGWKGGAATSTTPVSASAK